MWFYLYCVFTYLPYTQFHPHPLLAFHPWKQCVLSSQFNTNPKFSLNSLLKQLESLRLTADYLRRRQWHPTPVLLPGKSHGQRSLVGCSPWGRQESDTTELLTSLSLFTFMHWRRKWQPTPVFLPGESQGQGSLVGCRLWGRTEADTTEATQQQQQQHYPPKSSSPGSGTDL